ncbi:type II secretion system protein [Fimbriiglobus ruber]|uniref:Prepilin-type N-terminal cleavage/methylation domain-containing protein n=1 Tax=Fimbriiglobus ruber TaxID=1908690 RepID=A0A225DR98_9BACT|nr:prepilin-type N-terminal cleavage/methylation domain-containing protein [Fimbriiglobus ruber]OWK43613.1 hypothetical protein FRUB_03212 [Fimbriiglobus ruber]
MRLYPRPTPRPGFTLIELLVVIAIIAILSALTTAAVQRVRIVAKRAAAVSEINQLATSATAFKNDFGNYPPSNITIPHKVPPGVTSQEDAGYMLLLKYFPRWQVQVGTQTLTASNALQTFPGQTFAQPNTAVGIQFMSYNSITQTLAPFAAGGGTLDGNQCLVFFLGGPNLTGFDPAGPYPPSGTTRKGPYYDFQPNRLTTNNATNTMVWADDPWGSPYAYFASTGNSYLPTLQFPLPSPFGPGTWNGTTVVPYSTPTKPVNPNGIQIISAGANGTNTSTGAKGFGPGGAWIPGSAPYTAGTAGEDDLGNFNSGFQLGASGN